MLWLIIGLALFIGIHLLPGLQAARRGLIAFFGEQGYQLLFALLSITGIVFIVLGMKETPKYLLYTPPPWGAKVTGVLMLLTMMLLASANMKTNIKRFTRHPMLWGTVFWSIGHLLANGDKPGVILFSSFACFALAAMWSSNRRGAQLSENRLPVSKDLMVVAAGFIAFGIFLFLHPYLFGVTLIH